MSLIAITNPSDDSAQSSVVQEYEGPATPKDILRKFGTKMENGAQVAVIESGRVWQYIATRVNNCVALRNNNEFRTLNIQEALDSNPALMRAQKINRWIAINFDLPLAQPQNLKTYTVFGKIDSGATFRSVVEAKDSDGAAEAAIDAECKGVDRDAVDVFAIILGDHSKVKSTILPRLH